MRKYYGIELIEKLSKLFGPSGCEYNVADFIVSQISDCCDAYCIDRAGNVIAKICGSGLGYNAKEPKKVMISAHMDEVGVMISDFTEEGYLKFAPIGNIDPKVLCGKNLLLGDENKQISGIIASKAIHMQSPEERKICTPIGKMYIDIGAIDEADARDHLSVGDVGVFDSEFAAFGKDSKYIKGKALDGRLACGAMIEIMRGLKDRDFTYDIYFAFTCCQEVGFSAARVAAQTIVPDIAIVLDSVEAGDIAGVADSACSARLGEGAVVSLVDKGTIYDRALTEIALREADNGNIKAQVKRSSFGRNDASYIQRSCEGVRVLSLAVPVRYIHTASCVADSEDYISLKNLVCTLVNEKKL